MLALRVRILNRDCGRIKQRLLGVSEANFVLCEIRFSFRGIEFDLHLAIYAYRMHIVKRSRTRVQGTPPNSK